MTQIQSPPALTSQSERPAKDTKSAGVLSRLPYSPVAWEAFQIDRGSWKALVEAIFPNAQSSESVVLALSYCRARKLDPFKRNVHIVPIWDKERRCMVDTIWPGIGELRTTAFRTGEYAGRDKTLFGPDITTKVGSREMTFPEWAQVTVYRVVKGVRVAFAGPQVYWLETYATLKRDDDSPNQMWADRPRGQLDKCAEAAALRAAFPEEVGTDYIADEVSHQTRQVDAKVSDVRPPVEMPRAIGDGRNLDSPTSTSDQGDEDSGESESEAELDADRVIEQKAAQARAANGENETGVNADNESDGETEHGSSEESEASTPDYPPLPAPAAVEKVAALVATVRPEGMDEEVAKRQVATHIRTKMNVSWSHKMSRESQEEWYRRWMSGEFPWQQKQQGA